MAELRTDYKDQLLDLTANQKRKYRVINNEDGTISLDDVSIYSQIGDEFGAKILNEIVKKLGEDGTIRYNQETYKVELVVNGEWIEWVDGITPKVYLIENGVINESLLGDFTVSNYNQQGTTSVSTSIITESNSCKFYTIPTGGATGGYNCNTTWTSNEIDVTDYSKLVIDTLYYKTGAVGYNSNSSFKLGNIGFESDKDSGSLATQEYDISSLTNATLKVVASCFRSTSPSNIPGYVTVQNVWLE